MELSKIFSTCELNKKQSAILLHAVALLCGTNPSFVKTMLEESIMTASMCTALRFGIAAAAMSPLLLLAPGGKSSRYVIDTAAWRVALELGTWLAFGYGLQTVALTQCQSIEASIYLAFFLVLVPLFERLCGRQIALSKVAALGVSIVGIAIMGLDASQGQQWFEVNTPSLVPGLASSAMFALHLVRSEILQREVKSVFHLGAAQLLCCAVILSLWVTMDVARLGSQQPSAVNVSISEMLATVPWAVVLVTAIFSTACCQTGELIAVGKLDASTAALTLSMITVWGLVFGMAFRGDRLTFAQCIGAACIILSSIVPRLLAFTKDQFRQRKDRSIRSGLV